MSLIKASVVINTFNRANYLTNAMLSIAMQSHEVELIIVNGPSTDNTESVLDELCEQGMIFKRLSCPSRNLSESRNIGIANASGDIVLFIDDDAVAHRDWVARIVAQYKNPQVCAVGGFTFDHTGINFQCRYTVCDRFGNAQYFDTINPTYLLADSKGFYFPSLLGTNCSFRLNTLRSIGGFDEVFSYMLDETDVCLRIFDSGKKIVTVPDAYVFHKYAPSYTRTVERIPTSLFAPARSKAYFCIKHATKNGTVTLETASEIDRFRSDLNFSNRWLLDHKKITSGHFALLSSELASGIAEGVKLGVTREERPLSTDNFQRRTIYKDYIGTRQISADSNSPLKIYFVSQGYPPVDTSGIARWTSECAQSLTTLGHEVHVITRSTSNANHVDFVAGVWVHSVVDLFDDELAAIAPVPLPRGIALRAGAVLREIRRCERIWGVDIVSAPIWDVEGIFCSANLPVPVVTSLHTTYKLALPFKDEWQNNHGYRINHVDKVIVAEKWLLENSASILSNSYEIISEIDAEYDLVLKQNKEKVVVVPHGVGKHAGASELRSKGDKLKDDGHGGVKILFVGRLEPRKGPDQLLKALLEMSKLPEHIKVLFVGKSPGDEDPYVKQLAELTVKIGTKHPHVDVEFLGYVDDNTLNAHYKNADIFVAPSRFESFGLILIEAMQYGVPVIACDIGGMREIINSGVDGYLFKVDNIQELSKKLELLIGNPGLRAQLGMEGKKKYQEKFTSNVMGISLQSYFLEIVGRHCYE